MICRGGQSVSCLPADMGAAQRGRGGAPTFCSTHIAGAGVPHFLVEADVQVVARLVGQEEADGDGHGGGRQADVDLHLCLQDPQLPEAAAIAHHHGPDRLLDLGVGQHRGCSAAPGTPCTRCQD